MHHLCAFSAALGAGPIFNQDLTLVNDQHLTRNSGGKAVAPYNCTVKAAVAFGADIARPRIVAPSLRAVAFPHIRPIELAAAPADLVSFCIFPAGHEPRIVKGEEFNVQCGNENVGAQTERCLVWLEPRFEPSPQGPTFTLRGTTAVVTAADTWASGVITLEDNLPAGRYALIGVVAFGTNLAAVRLIMADGGPRPGNVALATKGLDDRSYFRFGKMGKLAEFEHNALPTAEFFGVGAGATQEIYLDVIKIV